MSLLCPRSLGLSPAPPLSLGGRAVISDTISGLIILVDQPFRVGDVIEIEELNKFGDVDADWDPDHTHSNPRRSIGDYSQFSDRHGARSSTILFPIRKYRVQREIGVAYGSDFDQVRRVTEAAVRSVEGVLPDRPVDAHFHDFGDSARLMRVRWWIDNVNHEGPMVNQVSEALEAALTKAGIDLPFNTENLIVQVEPKNEIEQLSPVTSEGRERRWYNGSPATQMGKTGSSMSVSDWGEGQPSSSQPQFITLSASGRRCAGC